MLQKAVAEIFATYEDVERITIKKGVVTVQYEQGAEAAEMNATHPLTVVVQQLMDKCPFLKDNVEEGYQVVIVRTEAD